MEKHEEVRSKAEHGRGVGKIRQITAKSFNLDALCRTKSRFH